MDNKQILILENKQTNFDVLDSIFSNEHFDCKVVLDKDSLDALTIGDYDLVLVNSHIKYITSEDLVALVHTKSTMKVPILYIDNSPQHNKAMLQECFDHGICEYFKKPFDKNEIRSRVMYHFKHFQEMQECRARVDRLSHFATVDQMSKSSSKMHMQAILKHQLNNYKRYKTDTSLICINLINVDKIVSVFGFERGEKLISMFSKELKSLLRESDALSRWSGSDFIVLLTNTNAKITYKIAQKINEQLSKKEILKGVKPIMAFGITEFMEDDNVQEVVNRSKYALKGARQQEYGRILIA